MERRNSMNDAYESIRQSLRTMSQHYHALKEGGKLQPKQWLENVRLLKPIAEQLRKEAQGQERECQARLKEKTEAQKALLDVRARLYDRLEGEKARLSQLDLQIIELVTEISKIDSEISAKNREVLNCQKGISDAKENQREWDIVFWATCWIPFVNIGTGCKKAAVDAESQAKAKVLGREIENLGRQVRELNMELSDLRRRKWEKDEDSTELAREITATNGRISLSTTEVNSLSSQIGLWQNILRACQEVETHLGHPNGSLEKVLDCFEELVRVEELLRAPTTDRFVAGRVCKGTSLCAGEALRQGEYLVSRNGKYIALLDEDNQLTVCNSQGELWSSHTQRTEGEGMLCLDGEGPAALAGTGMAWDTKRPGAASLVMEDNGDLVAYDAHGKSLWASDTFTYAGVDSECFQVPDQ